MPGSLPNGTVTFMFSDIEGSTGIAQRIGAGFTEVVGEHFRILRDGLSKHGGVEVKTTGDGVFAVFADASDAVAAAADIQEAIEGHVWPPGGQVRVRLGIHTGHADLTDGDYVGIDVHRAARVMDAGHGGQVLVSGATSQVVGQQFVFKELGKYQLRGLDSEEALSQLVLDSLPSEFPPLRTASATPNNLPTRLSSLIGRDDDIENVASLVSEHRVVTILGPGGVGKTSLAIAVGAHVVEQFPDGVFLVDLSDVSDPSFVVPTIAAEMGIEPKTVDGVTDALADKRRLLVFDNMEQIIQSARDIASILSGAPSVSVLATSQVPLRIAGEQRFPLAPLDSDVDSAGVRLFLKRALAVAPDFEADPHDVAELVGYLDGLPLAIELVAARANLFGPGEMLNRLRSGTMSYGSASDAPSRHRSLEDALGWSYALLPESTQTFFARLGVFAGPLTMEAAEEVGGGGLVDDPIGEIAELVDRSLLIRSLVGGHRFRMLDGIRRFAGSRLEESGERDEVVSRYVDHFTQVGRAAYEGLQGDLGEMWREELDDDLENLRAVLNVLKDSVDATRGLELLGNTWRFYQSRGYLRELEMWLEVFGAMPGAELDSVGAVKGLMGRGAVHYWKQNPEAAITDYVNAVDRARRLGDRHLLAESLYGYATSLIVAMQTDEAAEPLAECREIFTELEDLSGVADVIAGEAFAALNRGGLAGLGPKFAEAADLYAQVGRRTQATQALFAQAGVALAEGNLGPALDLAQTGIRHGLELRDVFLQVWGIEYVSRILFERGDVERAALLAGAAGAAAEMIGGGWSPQTIGLSDTKDELENRVGPERAAELMAPGRDLDVDSATVLALEV